MEYTTKNKGTCSLMTKLTIEDGIIKEAKLVGGCDGNTKGLVELVKGMNAQEAADRLKGIKCGFRSSSCPDQLSQAITEALAK